MVHSNTAIGCKALLIAKTLLLGGLLSLPAPGQPSRFSKLKKVLVLDKNVLGENGYRESRRNLNAAMQELASANGFEVVTLGQADNMDAMSAPSLAGFQVVVFNNNEAADRFFPDSLKTAFETWVRNGGGFVSLHMASAFIEKWPFLNEALVQCFYGPHGTNQPTATLSHDFEGLRENSEAKGIFKDLIAPSGFLDEFISFKRSPRGEPGVTILVTVDERTFSKPVNGPMGFDHPVVWTKKMGKGRVVHNSLGYSWASTNVYAQKDGYLKKLLYGTLQYAAGDFRGCTDPGYAEFSPIATESDPAACYAVHRFRTPGPTRSAAMTLAYSRGGKEVQIDFPSNREHEVFLADIHGKKLQARSGTGAARYVLPVPEKTGVYVVKASSGGTSHARRILVP